jgi:alpha-beta hydrolase superfamily lysophospholipase
MTFIEETITTTDGLRLYVRRREVENARGEVVIVHGFGEHSGRYGPLTDHLINHSYTVTAYDHRGHGLSDGLPGHVENFSEYEDDLHKIISYVRARSKSRNLHLIGHSMGGLVTLRYVAKKGGEVSAAILSAPLIAVAVPVPAYKLYIARLSARLVPHFRLDNGIKTEHLSRDPEVGKAYATDPLVNRKVSARWFTEATRAMDEVKEWAAQISLPVLVMHGTEDKLASAEATKRLFEKIGSKDKELIIYPGFYHELFNEPEKRELYARATQWFPQWEK